MKTKNNISVATRLGIAFWVVAPFVATIYGFMKGKVDGINILLLTSFWLFSGFGVTIGYHRCFTHAGFEIKNQLLKRLLAIGGSMAFEGPLISWVSWHWQHHRYTDKEGDPHSPHLSGMDFWGRIRGIIHSHTGWFFNPPIVVDAYVRRLCRDKVLRQISRQFKFWSLAGLFFPVVIGIVLRGSFGHMLSDFLWGGLIRVFFVHHFTWSVNSVCHIWGTREFDIDDMSTNFAPLALFTFGESWHHNHHYDMRSSRHGFKWWQFDPSWYLILLFYKFGWISKPYAHTQQSHP